MNRLKTGIHMLKYLILISEDFLVNKARQLYVDSSITLIT